MLRKGKFLPGEETNVPGAIVMTIVVVAVGGGLIVSIISIGIRTAAEMVVIGMAGVADTHMTIAGEVRIVMATVDLSEIADHQEEEEEAMTVGIELAKGTSLDGEGRDVLVHRAVASRGIGIGVGIDAVHTVEVAAVVMIVIVGGVRVGAEVAAVAEVVV